MLPDPRNPAANGVATCDIKEGFVRARRIGAGIMLITHSVFEILEERFPRSGSRARIRASGLPTGGLT
jgi:hypothetical protein